MATEPDYLDLLVQWMKEERAARRLVKIRFFPGDSANPGWARAVYQLVTGKRKTKRLDTRNL